MNKIKPFTVLFVASLVLALGVTLQADPPSSTSWEGSGDGDWDDYDVFQPWYGSITLLMQGYQFVGDWGNDESNHINAWPEWNSGSALFLVGHGGIGDPKYGSWYYNGTQCGKWEGHFAPSPSYDTCWGTWWGNEHPTVDNGNWWGDLSTD